jgi:hypothetical protein
MEMHRVVLNTKDRHRITIVHYGKHPVEQMVVVKADI